MKLFALTFAALLAFAPSAHAYDEDTHFYGTYAMARYAGIRPEVASQIALSAQWMDESYISDPTSMIFMPITGIKKRRLLHFPSSRVVGSVSNDTEMKLVGGILAPIENMLSDKAKELGIADRLKDIQFMTETTEDHAFASELLMQGLKRGNLMMASASIHVLEDSYAHAGTTAEQGHAFVWHWPDRPFASPEKYIRMVHTVMQAMTAIRSQLPEDALDCSLHLAPIPSTTPNCQMDAQLLADNYAATAAITQVVDYDVLKDPAYVRNALADFVARATKAGYFKMTREQLALNLRLLPIDGTIDTYQAAELLITSLLKNEFSEAKGAINIRFMLADMGRISQKASPAMVKSYVASFGYDKLLQSLVQDLLRWKVPVPLSDTHRMELEDDASPVRKKEIELRVANMQRLILNLFGQQIEMIPNPTKDDAGFDKEIMMDASSETKIPVNAAKTYVTFTLRDRNAWDNMIFSYLFPSMTAADLRSIVSQGIAIKAATKDFSAVKARFDKYVSIRQSINADKTIGLTTRLYRLIRLDHEYGFFTQAYRFNRASKQFAQSTLELAGLLKPLADKFLRDTAGTHIVPSYDNLFYRNDSLMAAYRARGIIKPFLGPNDVWTLNLLRERDRMQAGRAP